MVLFGEFYKKRRRIKMYIPAFWCGVVATILFELGISFVITLFAARKGGGNDETAKEIN